MTAEDLSSEWKAKVRIWQYVGFKPCAFFSHYSHISNVSTVNNWTIVCFLHHPIFDVWWLWALWSSGRASTTGICACMSLSVSTMKTKLRPTCKKFAVLRCQWSKTPQGSFLKAIIPCGRSGVAECLCVTNLSRPMGRIVKSPEPYRSFNEY